MSRYILLVILNAPFVIAGISSAIINFKLKRIGRQRLWRRLFLWVVILAGLIFAELIYNYLFSQGLTKSEPLSLFDVIQITAIVAIILITSRTQTKLDTLENRVQDLHQELSIRLSKD